MAGAPSSGAGQSFRHAGARDEFPLVAAAQNLRALKALPDEDAQKNARRSRRRARGRQIASSLGQILTPTGGEQRPTTRASGNKPAPAGDLAGAAANPYRVARPHLAT